MTDAQTRERQSAELEELLDKEQARAEQVVRLARQEEQALSAQELGKMQADMESLREELQREMVSAQDDLRLRLRQADRALEKKEDEMRAAELAHREWAKKKISEIEVREREVFGHKMEAGREKERAWSNEQVQRARLEEQEVAGQDMQRLRDDMEAISQELMRERRERQEGRRRAETDLELSVRTVTQLEERLEDESRRLHVAEEEAHAAHSRALDAEQSLRTFEADMHEMRHEMQLALSTAEEARKDAKESRLEFQDMQLAERERSCAQAELQKETRQSESSQASVITNLHRQLEDLKQLHVAATLSAQSAELAAARESSRNRGDGADSEVLRTLRSDLVRSQSDLAACRQQLTEAEHACSEAEERLRTSHKAADAEARKVCVDMFGVVYVCVCRGIERKRGRYLEEVKISPSS